MNRQSIDRTVRLTITVTTQQYPLKNVFRIARGAKSQADVVIVSITDKHYHGWAESVPYARYHESCDSVLAQIRALNKTNLTAQNIMQAIEALPFGAARNALDCAWWDLKAKQQQCSVAKLLSLPPAQPSVTAQTLSIDTPEAMASAVLALNCPPLVKVKLDNQQIVKKMTAISHVAPHSQFIIDANEGWSIEDLRENAQALKKLRVVLIEQPLPADNDSELFSYNSPIPLCADESCHTRAELEYLKDRYQVINIKLDKTGGLSEAVLLAKQAKSLGFELMLGCMVGSSLAMAPLSLLVNQAQYVDLDGPLLICDDIPFGLEFNRGVMQPLNPKLWGGPNSNQQAITLVGDNSPS